MKRYGSERVDAACARALLLNARSYKSIAAILKNGTDENNSSETQEAPILFPFKHPRSQLLQLIRRSPCSFIPPSNACAHSALAAMADTLVELQNNPEAAEMAHADWLGLLIDREATFRDNRRLSRRLTAAKLRQTATIREHRLSVRPTWSRSISLQDTRDLPMGGT